jgi:hypothetical protein
MPIDLLVEYTDGTMESFYVPYEWWITRKQILSSSKRTVLNDWTWQHSNYVLQLLKQKGLSKKSPLTQVV